MGVGLRVQKGWYIDGGRGIISCGDYFATKFRRRRILPHSQIPKRTLPHAHTALPKAPDFARGKFRQLLKTKFSHEIIPPPRPCRPPCSTAGVQYLVFIMTNDVSSGGNACAGGSMNVVKCPVFLRVGVGGCSFAGESGMRAPLLAIAASLPQDPLLQKADAVHPVSMCVGGGGGAAQKKNEWIREWYTQWPVPWVGHGVVGVGGGGIDVGGCWCGEVLLWVGGEGGQKHRLGGGKCKGPCGRVGWQNRSLLHPQHHRPNIGVRHTRPGPGRGSGPKLDLSITGRGGKCWEYLGVGGQWCAGAVVFPTRKHPHSSCTNHFTHSRKRH